ncbi:hypothetical protein BC831DRAFT_461088 [Entophlyctis helioformis]|nr:hypothetical protein BC831DRAFT_461088 [Entophlyctis helioformis]
MEWFGSRKDAQAKAKDPQPGAPQQQQQQQPHKPRTSPGTDAAAPGDTGSPSAQLQSAQPPQQQMSLAKSTAYAIADGIRLPQLVAKSPLLTPSGKSDQPLHVVESAPKRTWLQGLRISSSTTPAPPPASTAADNTSATSPGSAVSPTASAMTNASINSNLAQSAAAATNDGGKMASTSQKGTPQMRHGNPTSPLMGTLAAADAKHGSPRTSHAANGDSPNSPVQSPISHRRPGAGSPKTQRRHHEAANGASTSNGSAGAGNGGNSPVVSTDGQTRAGITRSDSSDSSGGGVGVRRRALREFEKANINDAFDDDGEHGAPSLNNSTDLPQLKNSERRRTIQNAIRRGSSDGSEGGPAPTSPNMLDKAKLHKRRESITSRHTPLGINSSTTHSRHNSGDGEPVLAQSMIGHHLHTQSDSPASLVASFSGAASLRRPSRTDMEVHDSAGPAKQAMSRDTSGDSMADYLEASHRIDMFAQSGRRLSNVGHNHVAAAATSSSGRMEHSRSSNGSNSSENAALSALANSGNSVLEASALSIAHSNASVGTNASGMPPPEGDPNAKRASTVTDGRRRRPSAIALLPPGYSDGNQSKVDIDPYAAVEGAARRSFTIGDPRRRPSAVSIISNNATEGEQHSRPDQQQQQEGQQGRSSVPGGVRRRLSIVTRQASIDGNIHKGDLFSPSSHTAGHSDQLARLPAKGDASPAGNSAESSGPRASASLMSNLAIPTGANIGDSSQNLRRLSTSMNADESANMARSRSSLAPDQSMLSLSQSRRGSTMNLEGDRLTPRPPDALKPDMPSLGRRRSISVSRSPSNINMRDGEPPAADSDAASGNTLGPHRSKTLGRTPSNLNMSFSRSPSNVNMRMEHEASITNPPSKHGAAAHLSQAPPQPPVSTIAADTRKLMEAGGASHGVHSKAVAQALEHSSNIHREIARLTRLKKLVQTSHAKQDGDKQQSKDASFRVSAATGTEAAATIGTGTAPAQRRHLHPMSSMSRPSSPKDTAGASHCEMPDFKTPGTYTDNFSGHDAGILEKVKFLLNARDISQSDAAVDGLELLLTSHIQSIKRYTFQQRHKFCNCSSRGHVSTAFYFVLSGKLEIFKGWDTAKFRLNIIGTGDSFGDRTMSILMERRTASVATLETTVLLRIDKRSSKEKSNRIQQLARLPQLSIAPQEFFERSLSYAQFLTYEAQQTISLEKTPNFQIYWVLSGSCRCIQRVPFLKRHNADAVQLLSYTEGTTAIEANDEIVEELLTICELSIGDHYPNLQVLPSDRSLIAKIETARTTGEPIDPVGFSRQEYIQALRNENGVFRNPVTVVTNTRVDIVTFSRLEFVEMAPIAIVLALLAERNVFDVPVCNLQEAFLQKRQWESYKKKVRTEVIGRRKTKGAK